MNAKTLVVSGFLLLFGLSLTAQDSTPFTFRFGNKYKIEIPHSMAIQPADRDTNILVQFNDAQYQFFYLAISKEPKANVKLGFGETFDLQKYYQRIADASAKQLTNGNTFTPEIMEINKISVVKGVVQGQASVPIRDTPVDFFITRVMFEDDINYYQLTIWTEFKLANDFSATTDKIIKSISISR